MKVFMTSNARARVKNTRAHAINHNNYITNCTRFSIRRVLLNF